MPLGWYLAQGLIPLGSSSSDDEEGPCELPDGRIVCGPHGLVTCGKCCTSYDFDFEDRESDSDAFWASEGDTAPNERHRSGQPPSNNYHTPPPVEDPDHRKLRKGTGQVTFSKFNPPSTNGSPLDVFSGRRQWMQITRMTHRDDQSIGIVFTDGACLNNGQSNPKAGWAFHHGILPSGQPAVVSNRLEIKGPFDDSIREQTSNRAELRAIIAALRFRHWPGEGFKTLVIATDSSYAVDGATKWCRSWLRNGWRTSQPGRPQVKNRDLWEALLGEAERAHGNGMKVALWHIPREQNTVADAAAKREAEKDDAPVDWVEMVGINV